MGLCSFEMEMKSKISIIIKTGSEVGCLNYPAAVEDAMMENLRTMYKEVSKLARRVGVASF